MKKLSQTEKKHFVCRNIQLLTKEDRLEIGALIAKDHREALKECRDGCRVDLSDIPEALVGLIYDLVFHKINAE